MSGLTYLKALDENYIKGYAEAFKFLSQVYDSEVNIALRRFLLNHGNIATEDRRKPEAGTMPYSYFE